MAEQQHISSAILQHSIEVTQDRMFVDYILSLKPMCTMLDCIRSYTMDKVGHIAIHLESKDNKLTRVMVSWCPSAECIISCCNCPSCITTLTSGFYPVITYGNTKQRIALAESMEHICNVNCPTLAQLLPILVQDKWRIIVDEKSLY